ncbi:MAG: autoinducer synthase [Rhodobacteraceae bacterium]|nr:autoinducer synthase [Paracoccaceae bacterium]
MIKYIYGDTLDAFPMLRDSMFRDRAVQFKERLKWDVSVCDAGFETDEYDAQNPLYMIYELPDGSHGGSMRNLPTTGNTMINDHFTNLTDGVIIDSPLIWETTRFCLSPNAGKMAGKIAASVCLAGCEAGIRWALDSSVGVFDARMVHIYKRIGWEPEILGTSGENKGAISAGLWALDEASKASICAKSGISPAEVEGWFDASFPEADMSEILVA